MSYEFITFVNNTPDGIDWKRIVITSEFEIKDLKGGSAHMGNPKEYACPHWLSLKKATEIWKLHTGKTKEFKTKEEARSIFWKYFRKKAVKPTRKDYSSYSLGEPSVKVSKPQKVSKPRNKMHLNGTEKIGYTGKQPRSKKNLNRLRKFYTGDLSVSTICQDPQISMADIKYDIRQGYAEIVG